MADFTPEQLRAEAISRGLIPADSGGSSASAAPMASSDGGLLQNGDTSNSFGFMSHPIANTMKGVHAVQDFAGGLMGGVQKGAAFLTKPIEYATHAAYEGITGNKVPHYDTGELFGTSGDQPVDLNKMISHNPDSFMSTIGKYAPAIAAGGASIPGQAVANGLWGAVQASPDQTNLGGYLPSGRIGAGVEDAALAAGGSALAKYGPGLVVKAAQKIGDAANYLRPDKDAAAFLKTLGSGTKEENVQALAKDIDAAYQTKLQDALSHKTPVYEQEGKSNIYNTPVNALPEGNLDKVAHYISPGDTATPQQLDALGKEIANYRKSGDFEDFTHNVSDIFNADMNETQIGNLEHALSIPTKADSTFMGLVDKNPGVLSRDTQEMYEAFKKKPTLNSADELQQAIRGDMGSYERSPLQPKLNRQESDELKQLQSMRNALKDEMQGHLQRVNPELAESNATFNQKYSQNVIPYQEEAATKSIVNEPKYIKDQRAENPSLPYNVTSSQMKTAFAEPGRQAQQIAGDIGEAGRNKILYNLLADETNPEAKGLANAILQAKQSKGYSQYITPEIENLAQQLLKRTKWRNRANYGAAGLAGAAGIAGIEEAIRRLY